LKLKNRIRTRNIIDFIKHPKLINGNLSDYQETALRLAYGLPLSKHQKKIARECLDIEKLPPKQERLGREFAESTFICGRRSGKSDRLASNIAVYEAAMGGHEKHLSAGERGFILLIAQDRKAAKILYRYILAKFENSPLLSQLLKDVKGEEIDLTNNLTISVFSCTFRAPRGYSVPVALCDELGYWRTDESRNPDVEIIRSIKPAQVTFPRSKLIKISSPYAKAGVLYDDFAHRHQRRDALCFKAPSWRMNPSISQKFLDSEREKDPEFFDREYAANFSASIAIAFERERVEQCVMCGRYELPYYRRFRYVAGVDPSGGGPDEFALAISHREGEKVVQDVIRGWRSKKPQDVVKECAGIVKSYHCSAVVGDRYSGEWVRDAFRRHGIRYIVSDFTASEAFLELLPLINQGAIELLDDKRQTFQLIQLERRTSRQGKDILSHPVGGHDDRPNALAHAAKLAFRTGHVSYTWGRESRQRREQAGYPTRIKKWSDMGKLGRSIPYEMVCFFCAKVCRSWEPNKGQAKKVGVDTDCQYCDDKIACRECADNRRTGPKQHVETFKHEPSLTTALKEGRVKIHEFHILGGQQ